MYEPYEYVMSPGGIVSSFRAYTESGHLALRPVYRVSAQGWVKLTPLQAASLPGPRHLLLDQDCVLVREEEVTPLVSWRSHQVDIAGVLSHEFPVGLREFLSGMYDQGAHVYLYGSRLLGRESENSDWDFMVDYGGNLAGLLESRRVWSMELLSLTGGAIGSIAA
ncbi:hypothetical protein ACIBF6_21300 [Streptosporangium amethystogenes]|uniref:hypothetical protein n=1 Tax=Streptosporangium amethystogenes TaxID=2002 RepID=UPI0037B60360